jgi:hypothetical protein
MGYGLLCQSIKILSGGRRNHDTEGSIDRTVILVQRMAIDNDDPNLHSRDNKEIPILILVTVTNG